MSHFPTSGQLSGSVDHIPCLIVSHGLDSINQLSLRSIIDCDSRLEIDVVHNPSPDESGEFITFARRMVDDGAVRTLCIFDENISNNAVLVHLLKHREALSAAEFVILSDGDVLAPVGCVDEQISILRNHPDLLACGLRMDAERWTDDLSVKADLVERYNTDRYVHGDYVKSATGMWLVLFRSTQLFVILDAMVRNGIRLTDGNIKRMGHWLFRQHWVATKQHIGRELNRERPNYWDTKSRSTAKFHLHSPEPPTVRYAVWNHDLVTGAACFWKRTQTRVEFPPLLPAVSRDRHVLGNDPVIAGFADGHLKHRYGFLSKAVSSPIEPGLHFIANDSRANCYSSVPHLTGESSLFFLNALPLEGNEGLSALEWIETGVVLTQARPEFALCTIGNLFRFCKPDGYISGKLLRESSNGGESFAELLTKNGYSIEVEEGKSVKFLDFRIRQQ